MYHDVSKVECANKKSFGESLCFYLVLHTVCGGHLAAYVNIEMMQKQTCKEQGACQLLGRSC